MFEKHPKGLIAASLANLGERFGFYTMMAILVLFLQAKFALTGKEAGLIYSTFYFSIYILALVGGIIADKTRNYKGTILVGIVLMALGYVMLAIPTDTPVKNPTLMITFTCVSLFVIAFGNGLFKGNLQALVGQMYDDPKYASMRDSGFSLFYMFINIGAIFAPMAAVGARNWWLSVNGFGYNADLPGLCHGHLAGTLQPQAAETFAKLAAEVSGNNVTDLTQFANSYLYIINKKKFPDPSKKTAEAKVSNTQIVEMSAQEVKQRILALFAVFGVVIFFWFSFHQNGLTLTFFAKEYTELSLFGMPITAELFQSLNPFFVVFLTPVVMAIFARQRAAGREPSTPKKIAIGMGIAATGFVIMAVGSFFGNLPMHEDIVAAGTSPVKVTPIFFATSPTLINPCGIALYFAKIIYLLTPILNHYATSQTRPF